MPARNTITYLQEHGIHPSIQRIAIMEYLLKHRTHPSVEAVYASLHPKMPTLSRTTVYNTLKLFARCGAVRMLTIDEHNVCFDGDMQPHAHFLCRVCGRIYDVPLQAEPVPLPDLGDYDLEELHYYYKGVCPSCKMRQAEGNSQSAPG